MCGIIGILGKEPAAPRLVDALRRLEYRGYDSAGVATLEGGVLTRRRAEGKLAALDRKLGAEPLYGTSGIGHTRWATHGAPVERNAHPHMAGAVAIVHNGIIENFRELREEAEKEGETFESQTDSEVVAHLINRELRSGADPVAAVRTSLARLTGAFALAILFSGRDDLMIGARRGSPLAVGYGKGEMFLGSDAMALAPFTDRVTFLDEGDWAVLNHDGVTIHDETGAEVKRPIVRTAVSALLIDKGNHRHFMAKEIHEQPEVISRTLAHYVRFDSNSIELPGGGLPFDKLSKLTITACGTAFYAALTAKYWFERYAKLPVDVDIASEFRYRESPLPKDGLAVFVSQSGETADTLASLRYCRDNGQLIASVVNVPESSIARESDAVLQTLAGPEIGVASTKAFTCQLSVLACMAIAAGRKRGVLSAADEAELVSALVQVPRLMADVLKREDEFDALAQTLAKAPLVLYLGRGSSYPLALEGALKLKEISYLHAEGFAAGELKHGPIALIDETVPVIALAPKDALFEKTVSNLQEVAARGGKLVVFSDAPEAQAAVKAQANFVLPTAHSLVNPILYAVPIQLLAYHTAVAMGTDVDQPRNLAKSVTVE
ncbi:glucosamine--fructose-6-phosphate aminotransferase [Rhodomicrobium udaipurense JA643]|uniref:Glutamine--fructose-6-phosphate aminotransferase [isomerizing] n=1 Tax=Rhodomicrobium udaipurense TaxID=1202716 RepID=A0A8I1GFX7_9HYPH|nr:glutamine--fructose-6-phosphate transaminase (isomerizing) [Rhodomicrobium udaipurense]KAI94306.1 glucosamine--fructose-6-phosphate aminotransferase [Rhodomicrobium udaipurense JA643]MBJ7542585.1 glutamine--fructose-6-phosphate transaminase (isomerizing) [Rhodomicrobium udaipurense]